MVCEQIATKLAPDIVKNTGLKIMQRTVAAEDRRLLADSANLSEAQCRALSTLHTGEAVVFSEALDSAVLAKIAPYPGTLHPEEATDQAVQQHMAGIPSAAPSPPLQLYTCHDYGFDAEADSLAKEALDATDGLARFSLHIVALAAAEKLERDHLGALYEAVSSRRPGYLGQNRVAQFVSARSTPND